MKTLQRLLATILLVLAIGIPTYAGDVTIPVGAPTPAPSPTNPVPTGFNASSTPDEIDIPALAMLAVELMLGTLSIY